MMSVENSFHEDDGTDEIERKDLNELVEMPRQELVNMVRAFKESLDLTEKIDEKKTSTQIDRASVVQICDKLKTLKNNVE